MKEVFSLVSVDNRQVVLKVNAEDNLTVALNPYINRTYDYITVTRGKNHILTVIKTDGDSFSFHWGDGGYTLISANLERLEREVVRFIEQRCYIPLELTEDIRGVTVYYNSNFEKWQVTFNDSGTAHWRSDTAKNLCDIEREVNHFIPVKTWAHAFAQTGIDIWCAVL